MDWLFKFDPNVQAAIISAIVSLIISIISFPLKGYIEKCTLKYKLKKEYEFQQKKMIKEKLAQSKTPLIKSAEELNYRLWNLSKNINQNWHVRTENELRNPNECYYVKSFVYRLLLFLYWIDKAEEDIYHLDFSMAAKEEKIYLKYIKVLKHFFCESNLLKDLRYQYQDEDAHFYKDRIKIYIDYINSNNSPLTYGEFAKKIESDYSSIKIVVSYITKIKKDRNNYQYNIITSFHLFLILFLNKYGLDYHYTSEAQFKKLTNCYNDIAIKPALIQFFEQNKIMEEVKWIIEYLGNDVKSRWRRTR